MNILERDWKCFWKCLRYFYHWVLLFFLLVSSFGCQLSSMLPDPDPRDVTPAVIRTRSMLLRHGLDSLSIKSIDKKPPTLLEYKWVVPPGVHTLELEAEFYKDSAVVADRSYVTKVRRDLILDAESGVEYVVETKKDGENIYFWVSELQSGRIVAGESPHGNALPVR